MGLTSTVSQNQPNQLQSLINYQKEIAFKQRQMQLATSYAMGKDRFNWYIAFYLSTVPLMIYTGIKKRNFSMILPVSALSVLLLYQVDYYYLNKIERVRREAERLIREEPELFFPPNNNGLYSTQEYIMKMNENMIVNKGNSENK
jgi:hypothetical protein